MLTEYKFFFHGVDDKCILVEIGALAMNLIFPYRRILAAPFCILFLISIAANSAAQSSKRTQTPKARILKTDGQKSPYKAWLEADVCWIITGEEKAAFRSLTNDEQRDQFKEAFWERRDPTPDTEENEFKEEHYRRILYANEQFASNIVGWKTDRGHIYIMYGPPDEIETEDQRGGYTRLNPSEKWHYRYLEGIGQDVTIDFVDNCMCGEYKFTPDIPEKAALLEIQECGLLNDFTKCPIAYPTSDVKRFPEPKFDDLERIAGNSKNKNLALFDFVTKFARATTSTDEVLLAVQLDNHSLPINSTDKQGNGKIFGRFRTLSGEVAESFADTFPLDITKEHSLYARHIELESGFYRFDIRIEDSSGKTLGTLTRLVQAPIFGSGKIDSSSLVLADNVDSSSKVYPAPGTFLIGKTLIHPLMPLAIDKPLTFKNTQELYSWMQVYNLSADAKTHATSATFEYVITNTATNAVAVHATESPNMPFATQVTVKKNFPLSNLKPGDYILQIKITDKLASKKLERSAPFRVD